MVMVIMQPKNVRLIKKHIVMCSIACIIIFITDYACPIRLKWGIPCLSCGLTRAWIVFISSLDLAKAIEYHPLFLFIPIYAWFLIHYDYNIKILSLMNRNIKRVLLITGGSLILITYIVRLTSGSIL